MAQLTRNTWVLVADEEKAMILESTGDAGRPALGLVSRHEAVPYAEYSDRPGRMPDPGANQRSAMEQPDTARLGGERFAGDLADMLAAKAVEGAYARLVLVAAPQVLGALRAALNPATLGLVVTELPKTLTRHPLPEIAGIVATALETA